MPSGMSKAPRGQAVRLLQSVQCIRHTERLHKAPPEASRRQLPSSMRALPITLSASSKERRLSQ